MNKESFGYAEGMNYELYPTLSILEKGDIEGCRTVKSILNAIETELRNAALMAESLRALGTDKVRLYVLLSKLEGLIKELNQLGGSPATDSTKLTTAAAYIRRSYDFVSVYNYSLRLSSDGTVSVGGKNGRKFSAAYEWRNIKALVCTIDKCCGLTEDGHVLSTERRVYPGGSILWNTEKLEDIVSISAGVDYMLALDKAGKVFFFGKNNFMQRNAEKEQNVKAVEAGWNHCLCLRNDGSAAAYGDNSEGQCDVEDWKNTVMAAAGDYFSAGLTEDGTVLLAGKLSGAYYDLRPALGWSDIISIAAGANVLAGLRADGTVEAAGKKYAEKILKWKNVKKLGSSSDGIYALTEQGELLKGWD